MKKKSLVKQATDRLQSMAAYGQSKHIDKLANEGKPALEKIYSYKTMINYQGSAARFAKWAKGQGCHDLEEARAYTGPYLQQRMNEGKSAWTVRAEAAALGKLYQVPTTALGVELPGRHREDVTQHRTHAWRGHFSETRHSDLVELCKATGLRRSELAQLRPDDIQRGPDGRVLVTVTKGKGGKARTLEALTNAPWRFAEAAREQGREFVVEHIPKYAPIHEYRAEFAREMYAQIARESAQLPPDQRYCARADRAGQWYDRDALKEVSEALGHSRLDVLMAYLK